MARLQSNTTIYGTANVQSTLYVGSVSSNNSTSNTTGSLIVTGGVGVSGNVNVSGSLTLDVTGNLGIGTTSPTSQLQQYLPSGTTYRKITNGSVEIAEFASTAVAVCAYGTSSNHPLIFTTNNAERVRFDTAGNVGIGNSSPNVSLDVTGTIRSSSATITSASSITPTANLTNQYTVTALAVGATFQIPSGTPIDGQKLTIRIKDNGTPRALTWTTTAGGYRVIGTTLPTTTVASKVTYVGCIYNSQDSYWDVIAVTTQT